MLSRFVRKCPSQDCLVRNVRKLRADNKQFSTSPVTQKFIQKIKDKILFEKDEEKRPSDVEIAQKGLPRNTPTLRERVARDSSSPLYVRDRKGGYHKGLTGTWQDYVDPNATTMEIVKDSAHGLKTEFTKFAKEVGSYFDVRFGVQDLPKPGEERLAFDFDSPAKLDDWVCSCDSTWGEGYSQASLAESPNAKGKALFSGVLDTKVPQDGRIHRAGYAGIKSVYKLKSFGRVDTLNWYSFTHLILRIRGDGRTYNLNLHYYQDMDIFWHDLMTYPLYTRGGPYWQTVVIPFHDFILTHMGKIQDDIQETRPEDVVALGITLMDDIDGPFHLEIDSIKVKMVGNREYVDPHINNHPWETYKMPRNRYNRP